MIEDSFHTSQVVLSQVELGLYRWAQETPAKALELADILWKDSKAELRLLAAYLLGAIPIQYEDYVIERIKDWAEGEDNKFYLLTLFHNGTTIIRQRNPQPWVETIHGWLSEILTQIAPDRINRPTHAGGR